ncbi:MULTISPECIES: potassium channel family protein [Rhodomicrobium]|uniref:potassium channel family protein n=1 Tax=Rhodomicrobium TaxID=1068 RepID=UPI000B4BA8F4|nr:MULTISPECIES: potassium channel family protein [Rhodomicrobium]
MDASLRQRVSRLYFGDTPAARNFRIASLLFEIALIVFFISTSFVASQPWLTATGLVVAFILLVDFLARWWINEPPSAYFRQLSTWTDLVVLISLVVPVITGSLLFLRAARAVRLFRSYHLLRDVYREYSFARKNREAIEASLNLLVFIFVMSAVVYVIEGERHPGINNFVDALYFTVSTLSTTGFGDITFKDTVGRLLSIFIMIVGVGLFLRLIQTIYRPNKVRHECPTCGLMRHDPDAVHCKHCGTTLHIQREGADD